MTTKKTETVAVGSDGLLGDSFAHELAETFLRWPLPESVCADLVATMHGEKHRVGTNLLSYVEAKQMMRDLVVPKLAAKDAEAAALRDALQALKDIVDGKRQDADRIAAIINGALRLA